ncbi:hypothetical protein CLIB1444_05S01442 [[Candida] jaroonii]|uniref:Uncharacterized protein n=1 Tax=[Candida] jaroonii TaxID=467808 RepID=A0ACA9Y7W9_9ASCO|nr:hypothetical protein CLIB1444_05S01442 [[Candida] jaroonii]
MALFSKHLGATVVRRWLYVLSIGFYMMAFVPFSVISYVTFYNTLIPNPVIKIPLHFQGVKDHVLHASVDLEYYKSQFYPTLNYDVIVNMEILCNRNRNDDIYPLFTNVQLSGQVHDSQFILNCDARYLYHENNWFIPYNLRFWTPPFLTNINKNTNLKVKATSVSTKDLDFKQDVMVTISKDIIINNYETFLEFHVNYQGFRFYITQYYYLSMIIGVSIFWSFGVSVSALTCLYFFSNQMLENVTIKVEKQD